MSRVAVWADERHYLGGQEFMGRSGGELVSFSGIPKLNVTNTCILQRMNSKRKRALQNNNDNNYDHDGVVPWVILVNLGVENSILFIIEFLNLAQW